MQTNLNKSETHSDKPRITRRAYTLRLQGTDPNEKSWRDALWQTHEAVNKGAKVFGDWLLTLRGGLDHTLAEEPVLTDNEIDEELKSLKKKAKEKKEAEPSRDAARKSAEEKRKARIRNKRILLALSWLSVESQLGAPEKFLIATGEEATKERNEKVLATFDEILRSRSVAGTDINEWKKDCSASLCAAIRDDAVWVNRSKAFDEEVRELNGLSRDYAQTKILSFFGPEDKYLTLPTVSGDESGSGAYFNDGPEFRTLARQWVSTNFGTGEKSDTNRIIEKLTCLANANLVEDFAGRGKQEYIRFMCKLIRAQGEGADALRSGIGWSTGRPSKGRRAVEKLPDQLTAEDIQTLKKKFTEEAEEKRSKSGTRNVPEWMPCLRQSIEKECGIPFRGERDHIGEFAVILDHAARRVSSAYTWIKLAENQRRRFEENAKKIENVPANAKSWLDNYCQQRSDESGALEPYRIRRRAVEGWEEVVAAWGKSSCTTSEDRIAAARALQDDPEIEKFGDIQLFEALAEDDAVCVWHKDDDTTEAPEPQPLIDYALAAAAEFNKRRFKVPAYRHPDALLHPVFCDFGKSRWNICFDVHKNRQSSNPNALFMMLWTGNKMESVSLCWQSKRLANDLALGQNAQNGGASEVARADRLGRAAANVIRSDAVKIAGLFEQAEWNGRLQAPRQQLETIAAQVAKHGWDDKTVRRRDKLQWLVTFSAKLQPQGPWLNYATANGLKLDQKNGDIVIAPRNSKNEWRGLAYPFWHPDNQQGRQGLAKHYLSHLPGLRVLSVDLGHRYAAACAVWEALGAEQMNDACRAVGHNKPAESDLYLHLKKKVKKQKKGREVEVEETTVYRRIGADKLPDGRLHPAPWARLERQFLIKLQGEGGAREASNEEIWKVHQLEVNLGRAVPLIDRLVKAAWGQSGKQKTRLDALCNMGWTPANQAQGSDEIDEDEGEARKPLLSIDELMSSTVRTMRLALRRHGDHARIAFAMTADYKPMPGDHKYFFSKAEDASVDDDKNMRQLKYIEFIKDALVLWHGLVCSRGWQDTAAEKLWNDHIVKLSGYQAPEEIGENTSGVERRKKQKENREKLYGAAKALAGDEGLRRKLHDDFNKLWKDDDELWKKKLRLFKDLILPRKKDVSSSAIRSVGGLSLTRLATLTEFRRKVQVGFFTRLHPDGTKKEKKEKFGQSALDALEHLREQRVKQLASRIAEAALGIGRMKKSRGGKDLKRPRVCVDKPCHAVVIEYLTSYRPGETHPRWENRQLMTWSSSKVKKYLAEACQLYGLHLREVSASYTSRQDSRTGAPGIRCQDVPVKEFMRSRFWRKQVAQAGKKQTEDKGDSRERFLCDLNATWKDKAVADWKNAGAVRIPLKGGEIFVSSDPKSPAARGIQADLNAAANIGLKVLTDPDWSGKWWYIPADLDQDGWRVPKRDSCQGTACLKNWRVAAKDGIYSNDGTPLSLGDDETVKRAEETAKKLREEWEAAKKQTKNAKKGRASISLEAAQEQEAKAAHDKTKKELSDAKQAAKQKTTINLWRNPSGEKLVCGSWREFSPYWNDVRARVVDILRGSIGPKNNREGQ